jgi:uncharacterized protein (DUF1501 family)
VQGKAEVVKASDLQHTLEAFAADRIALLHRHEAGARAVSHYDFNNTYQYVINREETQLGWLRNALGEFGAALPGAAAALAMPTLSKPSKKSAPAAYAGILEDDARHLQQFVERWTDRVEAVTHARHRGMLKVILGETLEQQRLFEQAAAGFEDLLGRRTGGVARVGGVLPTRWVE